jgi:Holliday junction resolvase YEN1
LRLLQSSIEAIFVFDGPKKPRTKRNKTIGAGSVYLSADKHTVRLIQLLGFQVHYAPGEAEAECALLQQEGIVDAVLSEDVDTLMFGSALTLRNWSSESSKAKSPTHVSVYEAEKIRFGKSQLDRHGMILVALMSGGDYDTDGIPRCGIKIACEAAKAGFGQRLCELSPDDISGLDTWRSDLARELRTNESKHFRQKNKTIVIPETFPKQEVLTYYTHPVTSSIEDVRRLKETLTWKTEIDVTSLRQYTRDVFEWNGQAGAKKFIRGLAPALLVHTLRIRGDGQQHEQKAHLLAKAETARYVNKICGERHHHSTDGMKELRVEYKPSSIVDVGWKLEPLLRCDGANGSDGEEELVFPAGNDAMDALQGSPRKNASPRFDPDIFDRVWVPETLVRHGIPLTVEDYIDDLIIKQAAKSLRPKRTTVTAKSSKKIPCIDPFMKKGAMDSFVRTTKVIQTTQPKQLTPDSCSEPEDDSELPKLTFSPIEKEATRSANTTPSKQFVRPRKEHWRVPPHTRRDGSSSQLSNPWSKASTSKNTSSTEVTLSKPGTVIRDAETSKRSSQLNISFSSIIHSEDIALPGNFDDLKTKTTKPDYLDLLSSSPPIPNARLSSAPSRKRTSGEYLIDDASAIAGKSHNLDHKRGEDRSTFHATAKQAGESSPPHRVPAAEGTVRQSKQSVAKGQLTLPEMMAASCPSAQKALSSMDVRETTTSIIPAAHEVPRSNASRRVVPRDSLAGAFKVEEGSPDRKKRGYRWSQVEKLDLSEY